MPAKLASGDSGVDRFEPKFSFTRSSCESEIPADDFSSCRAIAGKAAKSVPSIVGWSEREEKN